MENIDEALHSPEHQRITERLKAYWQKACKGSDIPHEADIDPDELDDIWEHCFLIDCNDSRFSYSYLGGALIEAYGDNFLGQEICEKLVYPDSPTLFNAIQETLRQKTPVEDAGEFTNAQGSDIRYRCVVMPLSGLEGAQGYILGAMRWRGYAKH
jgi:hypothetical protein